MPLKITKAAEPIHVDRLKLVIYGQPGRHFEAIASALGYRVERIAPINREAITARVAVDAVNLAEAV